MKELLAELARWQAAGEAVAIARVVDVDGSGPRLPGAAMAVTASGQVAGSVSGGCVEAAVVEAALETLATGVSVLHSFGYTDGDAFAVGLTCGGTIHIFVEPYAAADPLTDELVAALRAQTPVALATVVAGPALGAKLLQRADGSTAGSLGHPHLDAVVGRDVAGELAAGTTRVRRYGARGEARRDDVAVFIESFVPPPKMIIFGAVDFTAALLRVAQVLGFRVTVCDARPTFMTRARFPSADEIVVDWPNNYLAQVGAELTTRDAVCVLTHDAKFDVPAIVAALATDVGYLGAMGSRRTHADRLIRLKEAGLDDDTLARLHSPIGLDLGARTPEETAVSICAEIISIRTGREDIHPLRSIAGPIHSIGGTRPEAGGWVPSRT